MSEGEIPRPPNVPLPSDRPPPEVWEPARQAARRVVRPLERFLKIEASSGILLLVVAVIAMVWANSPFKDSYHHLWHQPMGVTLGGLHLEKDLHFVINDILMVVFFFVVGLEIRREMHAGELSELKRAALPVAAAVGGMLVPAGIYLLVSSPTTQHGWGVPMATDIAFAVGILALLGKRVPAALRVLLLALAIIDDIGAILVIAIFYSSGISLVGIGAALGGVASVVVLQRIGARHPLSYVPSGVVIWGGMLAAGVHPTIAGVVLGLLTPVRTWFGGQGFLEEANQALNEFAMHSRRPSLDSHELVHPLERLNQARREAVAPVVRLEVMLHPWVAFGIMPLFALANAGVTVGQVDLAGSDATRIGIGVVVGLAVGKPLGILGISLLAAKLGISEMPRGVNWKGLLVVGCVGGVGFTMALFIAQLAFSDPAQLGVAKLAVLVGSTLAGVVGLAFGALLLPKQLEAGAAISVDEAERSTEI